MGRDRDDVSVNDILSQLTKDEAVLEEVRKIAIRGLTAKRASKSYGDNSVGVDSATSSTGRALGQDESSARFQRQENNNKKAAEQEKVSSTATAASEGGREEELAFNIGKDSETYRSIYSTVQWYRDSFLIGSEFADRRSAERKAGQEGVVQSTMREVQRQRRHHDMQQHFNEAAIPMSDPATAMAHPLLLSSGESYLRSIYAVDLLRPYATWAVSKDGPMFTTAMRSLAQSIPLGQESCDWAMRENLLWVLKDEEWREFAKSITTTYVDRSYKGR